MVTSDIIKNNLNNCITDTSFLNLPGFRKGKVRDSFDLGDQLVLITTDRQSAFDRILASVPFKGQVLNQISAFWFDKTEHIANNHIISIPDPNVTIAKKCRVFPVEFTVRGYLTGSTSTSVWPLYSKGIREVCGCILPDGMVRNQKFDNPVLTPTTKSDIHDEPISAKEIVSKGIIDQRTWEKLEEIAIELFKFGTAFAEERGLILVDTKYELGMDENGEIIIVDEIHTPDSSRYWLKESYHSRMKEGLEPENIDKEYLRLWFKEHCDPYKDEVLPEATEELVTELSLRYIKLYEMITGVNFEIPGDIAVSERIRRNLEKAVGI